MSDEIEPYVVYRIEGEQMECALWQLKDGQKALAFFLSGDTATTYRQVNNLGAEWKIFRPDKKVLLQIMKASHEGGIGYAVLDPDLEKAKRIFDIAAIVNAAGSE